MGTTKVTTSHGNMVQKLCWERCIDAIKDTTGKPVGEDGLTKPARACVDACTSKFTDTALLVSEQSQAWQEQVLGVQQKQATIKKAILGTGAAAAVIGIGCYLFAGDE